MSNIVQVHRKGRKAGRARKNVSLGRVKEKIKLKVVTKGFEFCFFFHLMVGQSYLPIALFSVRAQDQQL